MSEPDAKPCQIRYRYFHSAHTNDLEVELQTNRGPMIRMCDTHGEEAECVKKSLLRSSKIQAELTPNPNCVLHVEEKDGVASALCVPHSRNQGPCFALTNFTASMGLVNSQNQSTTKMLKAALSLFANFHLDSYTYEDQVYTLQHLPEVLFALDHEHLRDYTPIYELCQNVWGLCDKKYQQGQVRCLEFLSVIPAVVTRERIPFEHKVAICFHLREFVYEQSTRLRPLLCLIPNCLCGIYDAQ